jgi:putative PIN family toxin of toxin-antitoxin system
MTRERVVIDTNVLISSLFLATSTPAQAVDTAVANAQLVATMETLRELIEKLHSPKFDRYVRRERRDALLERVASLVEIIDVLQSIRASRDPKDDKFLIGVASCSIQRRRCPGVEVSVADHCALSASAGSTLAARRAGIAAAKSAASTSNTGAADKIIGSHGVTPNN